MEAYHNTLLRRQSDSHTNQGSSLSSLVSTLVPTFVISIVVFILFLIFQKKFERVYGPRTYLGALRNWQRSPKRSTGALGWRKEYQELKDEFVLGHSSIDNYLWLRFFKILIVICFVGSIITWPVLFPVNATGGGGQSGLDLLSFSNIGPGPRYYASCLVGWVFLGFVMLVITRESCYYIRLRQQYYLSPFERSRISSRTVLFVNVPEEARNEEQLRREFAGVVKVWLVSVPEDLAKNVDDRDKAANKLETGEIKLITNYIKRQKKLEKKNKATEQTKQIDSKKDRPSHRLPVLKVLPLGKKVDTVDWSRGELARLTPQVAKEQLEHRNDTSMPQSACFIEFESVPAAHDAFIQASQGKMAKSKVKMTPAEMGVAPENVLWKNVIKKPAVVKGLSAICTAFVWFLCIFWTIPVAVIGAISNINNLTSVVPFLSFIQDIPPVILGVVTGLLPVILLAVLMALVPIVCMLMAKMFCPTLASAQLKVQGWYFPFQVIQVFLVTTFASGAAAVVQKIIMNPQTAPALLAQNLPRASNFYISYFILFGLMTTAMQFLNVAPLLFVLFLGKVLDKTPRKMFNRYTTLAGLGWGPLYPKFTNLGVIALAYSCIAPLVLGFATVGFILIYLGFRYNALFTLGTQVSTQGRCYARALKQLTVGIYLSEICLIGLYAIGVGTTNQAIGPLVLMVVFLAGTIAWQVLLGRHLRKMDNTLPEDDVAEQTAHNVQGNDLEKHAYGNGTNGTNGTSNGATHAGTNGASVNGHGYDGLLYEPGHKQTALESQPSKGGIMGSIQNFPKPKQAASNHIWNVAPHLSTPVRPYTDREHREAYMHPAAVSETPMVWIARDDYGISRTEVLDSKAKIGEGFEMTDEGASFNEKGKIEWHQDDPKNAPIWEDEPLY